MTDKELKRLKRIELLEILIAQDEEIEDLNNQLRDVKEQLARSNAIIDKVLVRMSLVNDRTEGDEDIVIPPLQEEEAKPSNPESGL